MLSSIEVPSSGPQAAALRLNLAAGEHPSLAQPFTALQQLNPFTPAEELYALGLPLAPAANGHHMVEDAGYLAAAGDTDSWPLAPVFVRDLAGRIIHTGFNPLPLPPALPLMPAGCRHVPADLPGGEALEHVFLTHFRRLEWAYGPGTQLSGHPQTLLHAVYPAPHLYPHKMRVDSFYQDGFRLPQTERLFVGDGENPAALGEDLLARWQSRPAGQDYQAFYDANNGDVWFEDMFAQGCTVVPTFEAYNGYFKVAADYTMEDVWPGCAAEGLHEVLDYRADSAPAGTILEVVRPGYAIHGKVVPAQVIASDGSGYQSPHAAPEPLQPNPQLPHPRVSKGAAVWLPTHPGHFEIPALWDWSEAGHFQQTAGPLWDPLHYVYTSTARIIRAFRHADADNPAIAPVPAAMQLKFHPLCPLATYDVHNSLTREFRQKQRLHTPISASAIDSVAIGREVAGIGYHPLPSPLEYELDPFVFPQLSPRHGADAVENPAPVIISTVTPDEARQLATIQPEPARQFLLSPALYPNASGNPEVDYPQLQRYRPESPLPDAAHPLGICYLPDLPTSELMINVKRFFASKAYCDRLDKLGPELRAHFFTFREEALAWRRLRHRLVRKYAGWYLWLWWYQHSPSAVHEHIRDNPDEGLIAAEILLHSQPGAQKLQERGLADE